MDSRVARLVPSDLRTRLMVVMLALAAVMATAGLALSSGTEPEASPAAPVVRAAPSGTEAPESATPAATPRAPRAARAEVLRGPRLVVPALAVDAPIQPIEMDAAGVLTPPDDVDVVGWWQRSARPGADDGQTLITGHSVRVGDGAMDEIGDLRPGERVEVRAGRRTTAYRATEVLTYSRAEVAAHAHELFGQHHGDGRLVLVTCTDWDGQGYRSNIIVLAERVGPA